MGFEKTLKWCYLHLSFTPPHFAEEPLIRHWSEPEVWSWTGHTMSESAVIIQQGNCQEIERQTGLKINLCQTLKFTFPPLDLLVPLFIRCAVVVFVLHYVAMCVRLLLLTEWDAGVSTAAPWDTSRHTHRHWPQDRTDLCPVQTDWGPCGWAEPCLADRQTDTNRDTARFTHTRVYNRQKDECTLCSSWKQAQPVDHTSTQLTLNQ